VDVTRSVARFVLIGAGTSLAGVFVIMLYAPRS